MIKCETEKCKELTDRQLCQKCFQKRKAERKMAEPYVARRCRDCGHHVKPYETCLCQNILPDAKPQSQVQKQPSDKDFPVLVNHVLPPPPVWGKKSVVDAEQPNVVVAEVVKDDTLPPTLPQRGGDHRICGAEDKCDLQQQCGQQEEDEEYVETYYPADPSFDQAWEDAMDQQNQIQESPPGLPAPVMYRLPQPVDIQTSPQFCFVMHPQQLYGGGAYEYHLGNGKKIVMFVEDE
jgi:hypothetical protein